MSIDKKALKIIFAGTPQLSASILQTLLDAGHDIVAVYTQPDKPAGRGQKLVASPVKALAMQHQIPVFQPKTLRDASAQEQLKMLNADVMIVAAYGLILPQAVLDAPQHGCINVHVSLLPRWRGAAPVQRAILAGDKETGVTIMQMDAGLDTGPMLRKVTCEISPTDTSLTLHEKLAQLGGSALLTVLDDLAENKLKPEIQDETQVTYAHKIEKEEANIDWQQSAQQIVNQVHAFNPWPMAQTHIGEQVLKIGDAIALPESTQALPGTIVHTSKAGIDVATGSGIIRLLMLQLPGSKMLSAVNMLNGRSQLFTIGTQLI